MLKEIINIILSFSIFFILAASFVAIKSIHTQTNLKKMMRKKKIIVNFFGLLTLCAFIYMTAVFINFFQMHQYIDGKLMLNERVINETKPGLQVLVDAIYYSEEQHLKVNSFGQHYVVVEMPYDDEGNLTPEKFTVPVYEVKTSDSISESIITYSIEEGLVIYEPPLKNNTLIYKTLNNTFKFIKEFFGI